MTEGLRKAFHVSGQQQLLRLNFHTARPGAITRPDDGPQLR